MWNLYKNGYGAKSDIGYFKMLPALDGIMMLGMEANSYIKVNPGVLPTIEYSNLDIYKVYWNENRIEVKLIEPKEYPYYGGLMAASVFIDSHGLDRDADIKQGYNTKWEVLGIEEKSIITINSGVIYWELIPEHVPPNAEAFKAWYKAEKASALMKSFNIRLYITHKAHVLSFLTRKYELLADIWDQITMVEYGPDRVKDFAQELERGAQLICGKVDRPFGGRARFTLTDNIMVFNHNELKFHFYKGGYDGA